MKRYILILLLGLCAMPALAQKEVRQQVRQGNKFYKDKEYQKAEIDYRKALEVNPSDMEANYNLANTLYRTERGEESAKSFEKMLQEIELLPAERAADVTHNAGNLMMAAKEYARAIELYKESLRRRPTDDETRYNLALAQKLLEQEENGGGKNDQENEDQEKDQEQNNQQDQQEQQQEPKEDNQKNTKPKDPEDQREQQMSKSNAEKILEAYMQDEKETQRKIEQIKQQQQQKRRPNKKNW